MAAAAATIGISVATAVLPMLATQLVPVVVSIIQGLVNMLLRLIGPIINVIGARFGIQVPV